MESASDSALDGIELTGTRIKLTVQSATRHSDFPLVGNAENAAASQDEILTVPAESKSVQFWTHQETLAGLTAVIAQDQKGHAGTYHFRQTWQGDLTAI